MKKSKQPSIIEHYFSIKKTHPDVILFYRLGDFYEIFGEDAIQVSRVLNIVLTHRGKLHDNKIEMCGVPHHSSNIYISRLIKEGFKVAICEQLESAEEAKSRGSQAIIKRDVVRILTPGTVIDDDMVSTEYNNYILALLSSDNDYYTVAYVNLSANSFFYQNDLSHQELHSLLIALHPSEVLLSDRLAENEKISKALSAMNIMMTSYDENYFSYSRAKITIKKYYSLATEKTLGIVDENAICSVGSIINYITSTQMGDMYILNYPVNQKTVSRMSIDASVIKSLELLETLEGKKNGSILTALDKTASPEGKRLFKEVLLNPLLDIQEINQRLDAVEYYTVQHQERLLINNLLSKQPDLERVISKFMLNRAKPYDLLLLKNVLESVVKITCLLQEGKSCPILIKTIVQDMMFDQSLLEKLSMLVGIEITKSAENNYIKSENYPELSPLGEKIQEIYNKIASLESEYKRITEIHNLKISNNNLIGYYIEVSSKYDITSETFIKKQGLSQVYRYTTSKLMSYEAQLLEYKGQYKKIEEQVFQGLCQEVQAFCDDLYRINKSRAYLDVIISFASIATQYNLVRPVIDESLNIKIVEGRHPAFLDNANFVANDLDLSAEQRMSILTAPNMSGKSTFLRQNLIIVVMSQMGMFVPAKSVYIGIIDKIFSRVGAYDNIYLGYSTFMMEMLETAFILNNATERSFVILDEVGRGTSLYDGLSIASAIIEYLVNYSCSRVLFATHYKELTSLADKYSTVSCLSLDTKIHDDEIIFTYKISPGINKNSYGIYVAKLAGMPDPVLKTAQEILSKYEQTLNHNEECMDG